MRSGRPTGQAVGKTDRANTGPYRIMDKLGDILYKLQDIRSGVTLSSLIHSNRLSHFPEDSSARLRDTDIPDSITPTPPEPPRPPIPVVAGAKDAQEIKMLARPAQPKATGRRRRGRGRGRRQ